MLSPNTRAHRPQGSTDLKGAGQEENRCGTVDSGCWPAKGRQELPDCTLPHPAQPSPGFGRKSHGGMAVGRGLPAAGAKPEIQTTVQLWDWVAPALTGSQGHPMGACHLVVAALRNPERHSRPEPGITTCPKQAASVPKLWQCPGLKAKHTQAQQARPICPPSPSNFCFQGVCWS